MTPDRRPSQPSPRWQRISLTAFREPGRHSSCERCLHPQLTDRGLVIPGLGPQPDQPGPLGLSQQGIRGYPRCRGLSCHLHPLAQSHLMDADVAGDLSNRTAAVEDESYRLLLVLRRKCAACRTHFSLSRKIRAAKPGVHRSGNGSDLSSLDSARSRISSARSDSPSGASGDIPAAAASRATFTHLPRVISWTPMLRATSATGRPPSMTKATDCSLYSGVNARRVEPISRSPGKSGQLSRVSTEAGTVQGTFPHRLCRALLPPARRHQPPSTDRGITARSTY